MADLEQLNDWELLHSSDSEPVLIDSFPALPPNPNPNPNPVSPASSASSDSSSVFSTAEAAVGSPEFEANPRDESECSGGGSDEEARVLGENQDMGFEEEAKSEVGFEGIGEIHGVEEVGDGGVVETMASRMVSSGSDDDEGLGEAVERLERSGGDEGDVGEVKDGVEENRGIVWWKLPFEVLKFCVFRVNPVWSLSVAAAVLGFVILRKRLNRMKPKMNSRNIPITLAVEDKKASQLKMHATRLNEAFSVVRSVPVVRARLLPAGVTPWPTLNLR